MGFTRADLRDALGEAYTDEIGAKLVSLHRSVVDPIRDDLDGAKRDATKWKAEAEKLPGIQKELDELKEGEDWKGKYEKEHADFDSYKSKIAQDAQTARTKAAYKQLLIDEKISEKALESVLNATDYSTMKLKDDGTLDGLEDLRKDIDTKWGGFKAHERQRGQRVDNPPAGGTGGPDTSIRERMAAMHAARFGAAPARPAGNNA